jgi:hypothetical protein
MSYLSRSNGSLHMVSMFNRVFVLRLLVCIRCSGHLVGHVVDSLSPGHCVCVHSLVEWLYPSSLVLLY